MTWWFTTFMAPAIKQKVQSLQGIEYLYAVVHPSQLEIPAFITEHDMSVSKIKEKIFVTFFILSHYYYIVYYMLLNRYFYEI